MALKRFVVDCSSVTPGIEDPNKLVIIYTPDNLELLEEREYIEEVLAEKYPEYMWEYIAEEPFPTGEGLEGFVLAMTSAGKDPAEMLQDLVAVIRETETECTVLNELERRYF